MQRDLGIRPANRVNPVVSGYGRARARHFLAEAVAGGGLPWQSFLRVVWIAYGGRRVSTNAYQVRMHADQETVGKFPLTIPPARMRSMCTLDGRVVWARRWSVDDWPGFNEVAKEAFACAVHIRRLQRGGENDG